MEFSFLERVYVFTERTIILSMDLYNHGINKIRCLDTLYSKLCFAMMLNDDEINR